MYPLVETIKMYNGQIYRLKLHQKRMDTSYKAVFGQENPFLLHRLIKVPPAFTKGLVKIRFLYDRKDADIRFEHYRPKIIRTLKIVCDDNISYSHKYTERKIFDRLLLQKGDCDDILIVKQGLITDTSIANIAFYDPSSGRWVTPAVPLLKGVCREARLQKDLHEEIITVADLHRYDRAVLLNAMICDQPPVVAIENIII